MSTKLNLTGKTFIKAGGGRTYFVDTLDEIPLVGSIVVLSMSPVLRGLVVQVTTDVGGWGQPGFVVQEERLEHKAKP